MTRSGESLSASLYLSLSVPLSTCLAFRLRLSPRLPSGLCLSPHMQPHSRVLPIPLHTFRSEFARLYGLLILLIGSVMNFVHRIATSVPLCGLTPTYFGSPGKSWGDPDDALPDVGQHFPLHPNLNGFGTAGSDLGTVADGGGGSVNPPCAATRAMPSSMAS